MSTTMRHIYSFGYNSSNRPSREWHQGRLICSQTHGLSSWPRDIIGSEFDKFKDLYGLAGLQQCSIKAWKGGTVTVSDTSFAPWLRLGDFSIAWHQGQATCQPGHSSCTTGWSTVLWITGRRSSCSSCWWRHARTLAADSCITSKTTFKVEDKHSVHWAWPSRDSKALLPAWSRRASWLSGSLTPMQDAPSTTSRRSSVSDDFGPNPHSHPDGTAGTQTGSREGTRLGWSDVWDLESNHQTELASLVPTVFQVPGSWERNPFNSKVGWSTV